MRRSKICLASDVSHVDLAISEIKPFSEPTEVEGEVGHATKDTRAEHVLQDVSLLSC